MSATLLMFAALAAQPAAAPGGPDPERVVCRRDSVTGSRTAARRVCRTQAEWERLRLEAELHSRDITGQQNRGEALSREGPR